MWVEANRAGLGRNRSGGKAALLTNPKKGRADKQRIIYADRRSDAFTVDKKRHKRMTPDEP